MRQREEVPSRAVKGAMASESVVEPMARLGSRSAQVLAPRLAKASVTGSVSKYEGSQRARARAGSRWAQVVVPRWQRSSLAS